MSEINYDAWELDNECFVPSVCKTKNCLKQNFQENSSKNTSVEKKK